MAKKPKNPARKARKAATEGNTRRGARENTKQSKVVDLLRRPEGATIAQLVKATGWQPHTVRGALAGAYGLSYPKFDIGSIDLPRMIENVPQSRVRVGSDRDDDR